VRIAFVIDHYVPGKGGLERWIADLAEHLAAAGHDLHLVSGDPEAAPAPFTHHPIRARAITRSGRDREFAERARILCGAEGFDTVAGFRHLLSCDVYAPHGGSIDAAFAAHRAARRRPPFPSRRVNMFRRLERELLEGRNPPRAVLAVSNMVRDDLAGRYPKIADRIHVVPNGVDLDRFSPGGADRPDGGTLLFVAGNPRLKGWRFAREAFIRLKESGHAARLLVAGGDPGRLPDGAEYLGNLDRPEDAYRAADVLLHPTYYDPFPLVTLEALACGTPVVTTEHNGALAHLESDGPVAAVAGPGDVEGMVTHAARLLREKPRSQARQLAERFPIGKCLEATETLLVSP
jgi:UDP-glucose:(heptosyl)LPS alpha-1,3-glucosyltransferase